MSEMTLIRSVIIEALCILSLWMKGIYRIAVNMLNKELFTERSSLHPS